MNVVEFLVRCAEWTRRIRRREEGGTRVINSPLLSLPPPFFPRWGEKRKLRRRKKREGRVQRIPRERRGCRQCLLELFFLLFCFFLYLSCFLLFSTLVSASNFRLLQKKEKREENLGSFLFPPGNVGNHDILQFRKFYPLLLSLFFFSWCHIASDPCSGIPLPEKKKKGHQLYDLPTPGKKARKSPFFPPRHGIREMWISSPGAISPQIKGEFPRLSFFFLLYLHPRPEKKRSGKGIRKSSAEFNIRDKKGVSKRLTIYLCSIFVGKLPVAL